MEAKTSEWRGRDKGKATGTSSPFPFITITQVEGNLDRRGAKGRENARKMWQIVLSFTVMVAEWRNGRRREGRGPEREGITTVEMRDRRKENESREEGWREGPWKEN